jgi:cell division protein FtsL
MSVLGVFTRRVRGSRVLDLAFLGLVPVLALSLYTFKTFAGRERSDIADVETQIRDETRQVLLLRAQIAHLESPDRLEKLATQVKQAPVAAKQEVAPDALGKLAAAPQAAPSNAAANAAPAETGR